MSRQVSRLRAPAAIFLALVLLNACGCRRGDRPELGQVVGTVLLDEKPLPGAIVYFSPTEGGRVSQAMTDAEGKYDLIYIGNEKGAKVGPHKVRITTAYETVDEKTGQPIESKERIPRRYNSEQTELTAEVLAGENTVDFPLKSE